MLSAFVWLGEVIASALGFVALILAAGVLTVLLAIAALFAVVWWLSRGNLPTPPS